MMKTNTGPGLLAGATRYALAGALALAGLVLTAQAASASWLFQGTPVPPGATTWEFSGISCPATGDCAAVGSFTDGSGSHMLAESGSGGTWTLHSVPGNGQLSDVSCTSASACTAVGSFFDGTHTVTLAERWDGSTWSAQATPNPGGTTSAQFNGVSCVSETSCTAVGNFAAGGGTLPLAETWDGSTWRVRATPVPAGGTSVALAGVACSSGTVCTAVGSYFDGSRLVTLAERWNGTTWNIQSTPNPPAPTATRLDGVSCPSATDCTAVGDGIAEGWNGTSWSLQTIARPAGEPAELNRVSCSSRTACRAVGGFFNHEAIQTLVAQSWDGSRWTIQATPIPTANDSSLLDAVSCRSANSCLAAGSYHDPTTGNRALMDSWALRWQDVSPALASNSVSGSLDSVACASTRACMAVGNVENNDSTFTTVAQRWDGSFWTDLPTPDNGISNLDAVSCPSATDCTAVGDILGNGGTGTPVPLAEHWNGSTWTAQSLPLPAGAARGFLLAVSCPSTTTCTAAGFYIKPSGSQFTLAERWNGSTWAVQHTPTPSGSATRLEALSCPSATSCTAVGHVSPGGTQMLAETWNGSTWAIKPTPLPAGGSGGSLFGVSCVSASECTAVGGYFNGSRQVPLAERWQGGTWSAQVPSAPAGATSSGFSGVSCVSATACTAVGFFFPGQNQSQPLAEHWNGSHWAGQFIPLATGAQSGTLESVDCTSLTACLGTGFFTNGPGTQTYLAERYS